MSTVTGDAERRRVPNAWKGLMGRWEVAAKTAKYLVGAVAGVSDGRQVSMGVAASDLEGRHRGFTEGNLETRVQFEQSDKSTEPISAGLILGLRSLTEPYYYVEIANNSGFSISTFDPAFGYRALERTGGDTQAVTAGPSYLIRVTLRGQIVHLEVDGVRVLQARLPNPPRGSQVAVIASGACPVTFSDVAVIGPDPRAFVAMQFGPPFDRIWENVVKPACKESGFNGVRIDEVAGPRPILDDIKEHISRSTVVIAEVTPPNPNVFYEVGFADALKKPIVLLAQKGSTLPFDIHGYRTVFYEDVIGGNEQLHSELAKQLKAVGEDRW